jgi:hypothetical protein
MQLESFYSTEMINDAWSAGDLAYGSCIIVQVYVATPKIKTLDEFGMWPLFPNSSPIPNSSKPISLKKTSLSFVPPKLIQTPPKTLSITLKVANLVLLSKT